MRILDLVAGLVLGVAFALARRPAPALLPARPVNRIARFYRPYSN